MPDLILRRVTTHPHVDNAYQVFFDGLPIGSISLHLLTHPVEEWRWAIYGTEPYRSEGVWSGAGETLNHCMSLFRAAWEKFSRNPDRLAEYLEERKYQQTGRVWNRPA